MIVEFEPPQGSTPEEVEKFLAKVREANGGEDLEKVLRSMERVLEKNK